jgi:hypothetical protein
MRALVGLLGVMSLTGCLSTNPAAWSHAPDEETRARAAIYECRAQASDASWRATQFGGAIVPLVGLFAMRGTFNECMAARGFKAQ